MRLIRPVFCNDRSVEMRPGNGALLLSSLSGNGISKRLQNLRCAIAPEEKL